MLAAAAKLGTLPSRRLSALGAILLACLWIGAPASAATSVTAVRVWPAPEYTRFTIETDRKTAFNMFFLGGPDRLVIDLKQTQLGDELKQLPAKLAQEDPFISAVRVGQFSTEITRVVFELRQQIKPQVFSLEPIGDYGHRLVIDIYPTVAIDPILALLQDDREEQTSGAAAPPQPRP